jgi:hypothetical protein
MISGSQLPPCRAAQRYIGAHGRRGATTIVGSSLTAAPGDAAFADGVMAHADETDDSHNPSPHRECIRVRRHAGAQRGDLGIGRAHRLEWHRRHLLLCRQLLHRHRHQEVERRLPIQGPLDAIEAIRTRRPFEAD